VKVVAGTRRRARRPGLNTLLPHTTHPPPAASSALQALHRAGPPALKAAVAWARAGAHAGTLASLARAFLKPSDAHAIERFLRAGHHDQAAKRFCERFSERQFPLEYAHTEGDLIVELAGGIQHEGWGENWQEWGDMWSVKPVFALSWALMEDPYDDEFFEDDVLDEEPGSPDRLCDEARAIIADVTKVPARELFDGVPRDGFPAHHLSSRFTGTRFEPLLWAAPWLWRTSGNPFLDRNDDDYPEPDPWSASGVFYLTAQYREALRITRAVDGFDTWLLHAPAERMRAAVQAAMGAPSNRISTLLDLPIAGRHCPQHMAAP
jgi:hypothetical protein